MNGGENLRDWIEIVVICASILGTAGVAIHRMTRMITVMEMGFRNNSKEHNEIIETQKCQGRLLSQHDRDIARLQQTGKDAR